MPKQSNLLWNYFSKSVSDGDKVATCIKCKATFVLKDSSTSSMRYHIKSKHPLDFADMQRNQADLERLNLAELEQVKASAKELDEVYGKVLIFIIRFNHHYSF